MADVNCGFSARQIVKIVVELALCDSVKSGGRLIQNHYRSALVQRPCKRKFLLFAAREVYSVVVDYFQDLGVNSARKLREFFAEACVNKAFLRKRLVGLCFR